MAGVFFHSAFFSYESLKHYTGEEIALQFCRDWLNGLEEVKIRTSGSTGIPKEITLERTRMQWSARATKTALGLSDKENLLLCLDIATVGGLMMLVRAMEWNNPITLVSPSGDPLASLDPKHDYTFTSFVPLQLIRMLSNPDSKEKLKRFKTVLIGGAPLNEATGQELQDFETTFYHSYGMSETSSHIAIKALNGPGRNKNYQPLPGVNIFLDHRKCLVIESPSALNGKVVTNDIAEIFPDGTFEILGRDDFAIISGGVKILPEMVEKLIGSFMKMETRSNNFFCYGVKDDLLGEKPVVFMEGDEDPKLAEKLLSFLRNESEKYKTPKAVIFVPAFRQTSSGKTDRKATVKDYHG